MSVYATPVVDAENAAAIALLNQWIAEDATDDPEEIRLVGRTRPLSLRSAEGYRPLISMMRKPRHALVLPASLAHRGHFQMHNATQLKPLLSDRQRALLARVL